MTQWSVVRLNGCTHFILNAGVYLYFKLIVGVDNIRVSTNESVNTVDIHSTLVFASYPSDRSFVCYF